MESKSTGPQKHIERVSDGAHRAVDQAANDVSRGLKDTERRGVPNDIPAPRRRRV